MADNGTVQGLIALANNGAASMEERRTAAFQAVTIMHKRNLSGEPERLGLDREFERRMFNTHLKAAYTDALSKVLTAVETGLGGHIYGGTGYVEFANLCAGFSRIMGDIILTPSFVDQDLAPLSENIRFVAAAFRDWESRQAPVDTASVRSAIVAIFDEDPTPTPSRASAISFATRIHAPVSTVQSTLDELVDEGLLRCKGGSYSKAKRPRKAKAA